MIKAQVQSKWKMVKDKLCAELNGGKYSVGDDFYSISILCDKFAVSEITAKRVFKELKNEGWIKPIQKRGTIVCRDKESTEIVFVSSSRTGLVLENWIVNRVFSGVQEATNSIGEIKSVSLDFLEKNIDNFIGKNIIMTAGTIETLSRKGNHNLYDLLRDEIHPVLVMCLKAFNGFSCIGLNYKLAAELRIRHLTEKGIKRIAYISGDLKSYFNHYPKYLAHLEALQKFDADMSPALVKITKNERNSCFAALDELLSLPKPPRAILCANDNRAFFVMEYCRKHKIKIPKKLALIGYDNQDEAAFTTPPLTTLDTMMKEQGRNAVKLLLKRKLHPDKPIDNITIDPELIIREST